MAVNIGKYFKINPKKIMNACTILFLKFSESKTNIKIIKSELNLSISIRLEVENKKTNKIILFDAVLNCSNSLQIT